MYTHTYTRTHIYTHIHIHTQTDRHTHTHVHTRTHIHTPPPSPHTRRTFQFFLNQKNRKMTGTIVSQQPKNAKIVSYRSYVPYKFAKTSIFLSLKPVISRNTPINHILEVLHFIHNLFAIFCQSVCNLPGSQNKNQYF